MSNAASSSRLLAGLVFIMIGSAVLAHEAAPQAMSIDDLKRGYISCSEHAMKSRLDNGGTMYCSVIYEELKRRAFGGDFDRLLAWSRSTDGGYFDPASKPRALPREMISRH